MKEFFAQYWLSVLVIVYLVVMTLYGHYRGFVRQAVSVVALIASVILVNIGAPYVKDFLLHNESVCSMVQSGIESILENGEGISLEQEEQPYVQRSYIEGLELPEQIKELLLENNNSEVYSILGVDSFGAYLVSYITEMIISAVSYILVFLTVFVLLHVLLRWLDLVAHLPILSGMNQLAGAGLGLAQGLIFVWIGSVVLTIFATTSWGKAAFGQIQVSPFLTFLYRNNILVKVAISILHGL